MVLDFNFYSVALERVAGAIRELQSSNIWGWRAIVAPAHCFHFMEINIAASATRPWIRRSPPPPKVPSTSPRTTPISPRRYQHLRQASVAINSFCVLLPCPNLLVFHFGKSRPA